MEPHSNKIIEYERVPRVAGYLRGKGTSSASERTGDYGHVHW